MLDGHLAPPPSNRASRARAVLQSVFRDRIAVPVGPSGAQFTALPPAFFLTSAVSAVAAAAAAAAASGSGYGVDGVPDDQRRWDRAWALVTAAVELPASVAVEDSFGTLPSRSQHADAHPDFHHALATVLRPEEHVPGASHTADVLLWHAHQVRRHYGQHVLPLLAACDGHADPNQVLLGTVRTLEAAQRQYLYGAALLARGLDDDGPLGRAALARFRRDLHAVVGDSASSSLMDALIKVLGQLIRLVLGVDFIGAEPDAGAAPPAAPPPPATPAPDRARRARRDDTLPVAAARTRLLSLMGSLAGVGLAGERFQLIFAETMDQLLDTHIRTTYARSWPRSSDADRPTGPALARPSPAGDPSPSCSISSSGRPRTTHSPCVRELRDWVGNHYGRLVIEVLAKIGTPQVGWADVGRLQDMAVGRLALIRIRELYDMVLYWPDSWSDLEDLRTSVATPQKRLQLTDAFSAATQRRLLHPGRSTLDILRVYIATIRAFHALDPSKVLLSRVARPIQLYLCRRDDAIGLVISGLLSGPGALVRKRGGDGTVGWAETLAELAVLLWDPSQQRRHRPDEDSIDWDDMGWTPDPIDAGVGHRRPKSEDVIGTLIAALGAQDLFIRELQTMLADRLLAGAQTEFSQEERVLQLLKKRYGENALQNCEVMLRDVADSRQVDDAVTRFIASRAGPTEPDGRRRRRRRHRPGPIEYHAKILSRLFWPTLSRERFTLPPPVLEMRKCYEEAFGRVKQARRLTWIDNIGTAAVRLELDDGRTMEVECKTYEAAVIYAFGDDQDGGQPRAAAAASAPTQRTVSELEKGLALDRDLLEEALLFWTDKGVLRRLGDEAYAVGGGAGGGEENPASASAGGEQPAAVDRGGGSTASAAAATTSLSAQEKERRQIYWQFIVGMLTNSSPAMALANMATMMRMLIPGGFAWSNEDLRNFLAEKEAAHELDFTAGKYKLPKK